MSPVPASAITIADGEITIDADLLAPMLGLSSEALKAKMRKGIVSSVAETGINEDAGRTRVTFRYRTRAWTVVVDPDGTWHDRLSFMLVESIAPAAEAPPANTDHPSLVRPRQGRVMTVTAWDPAATTTVEDNTPGTLARRLRVHLQTLATRRLPITYQEATKGMFLSPPNTIHQVTEALEQLMAEDAAADRPFIAAMVISKARGGLPAPGFFDCAARLGRFAGDVTGPDARVFHAVELNAVLAGSVALTNKGRV